MFRYFNKLGGAKGGRSYEIGRQLVTEVGEDLPDAIKYYLAEEHAGQSKLIKDNSLDHYSKSYNSSRHGLLASLLGRPVAASAACQPARINPIARHDHRLLTSSYPLALSSRLVSTNIRNPLMPVQVPHRCLSSALNTLTGGTTMAQKVMLNLSQERKFYTVKSKVHYLDFRHRNPIQGLKISTLIIRRQKMKKHQRRKFRRKFKFLLAKKRMQREIAKEKAFRIELLSIVRMAERFDPKEFALKKIAEINNKPREKSKEETLEELKELIRVNRHQVTYIKPKHRRAL